MRKYDFVNPYNFIPLGSRRADADKEKGMLTGVIEYSLYTRTPLFIPNTSNDKAFQLKPSADAAEDPEHKSYDFFSYTDLSGQDKTFEKDFFPPVIPGSEIRGMLRSNYEILTNSCICALDSDTVLSKRTAETYQPALIKKNKDGTYDLYDAEDCLWRTMGPNNTADKLNWHPSRDYVIKCYRQKDFREGSRVYFKKTARKGKPLASKVQAASAVKEPYGTEGYMIKGEDGPQMNAKGEKHCCHIFAKKKDAKAISKNISLDTLHTVLKEYAKNKEHEYKEYKAELEKFQNSDEGFFPVYYSKIPVFDRHNEMHYMFSPACITREIYKNKRGDMVKGFQTCTDSRNLCPACALFGAVGNNFQVSSRIRFSDLTCRKEDPGECYDKIVTLRPLASPKLNNMEFYVQRPENAWFWTYDYYVDAKGNLIPYIPQLNGRKFYWHQTGVRLPQNVARTNLNMTVRPVKEKVEFSGKLYFQKLTERELNQLVWLLNTGDNGTLEQKAHGYKLGAAKPLGLGSVAMSVDRVCLRKLVKDKEKRTVYMEEDSSFGTAGKPDGFAGEVLKNFEKMTSFDAVKGEKVCYPVKAGQLATDEDNGYEWFVNNHIGYSRKNHKTTKMPNTRIDMCYAEYMKPMEPGLQKVTGLGSQNRAAEKEKKGSDKKTFPSRNKSGNKSKNQNEQLQARIKEIDQQGNMLIDVNGQEGKIMKKDIPITIAFSKKQGDMIQVVFEEEIELKKGKKIRKYRPGES